METCPKIALILEFIKDWKATIPKMYKAVSNKYIQSIQ